MTKKAAALVVGFVISAFAIQSDVARGAAPSAGDQEVKFRLSAMRMMADNVARQVNRHLADAAEAGGVSQLSADDEARLARDLATAESLLAELGPQASIRDSNTVRIAADRLRLLKGEEPAGQFGPAFGPMAGTGIITGTVTDANTAAPIASAYVYVYDCAGRYMTAVATNASGVYTTPAVLETGSYYATAEKAGAYVIEIYNNILFPPNGDVTVGTPINVTSGATTSNINFGLIPLSAAGGISGTVTNAGTAAPLATNVYIFDATGDYIEGVGSSAATGAYATSVPLKTGTYYAFAFGTGGLLGEYYNNVACAFYYLCPVTSGTPISVTAGSVTSGVNFGLSPGGRISGTVLATTGGTPIAGYVYVYNSANQALDYDYMDAAGLYLSNAGLPDGNYFVRVYPTPPQYLKELYNNILCEPTCTANTGTPIATTAGTTTSGINFSLDTGGGISGTVIDGLTSAPMANVNITIYTSTGSSIRTTTTNASGVYTALGLPTGSYFVRATSPTNHVPLQYNNNPCLGCSATSGNSVAVTAPATTGSINFTMNAGGAITGRVTNSVSGAGIGGVLLYNYTSGNSFTGVYSYTTCTGDYSLQGLTTGSYKEYMYTTQYPNPYRYRAEMFDNVDCAYSCSFSSATLIPVTQGATTANINQDLIRYTTVADFDANRTTDIGVYSPASGLWFIRNQFTLGYGGAGATIVPGDYDGDLYVDPAVYYEASGLWYVRRSTTGTDLVQGFGGPGYKAAPGDYDGDGKNDFAVFHEASGIWFIKYSSNGVTVSFGFGSSGATLVPADYDRDGKTDAAVYYEASGLWYIRQSSSLITFSTGYGAAGYKPVRGDFDGDGRWDIAVFHDASGIWFIRNWGTGATTSIAFGASGYTPVPGDYTGDSKADLGVYDEASGLWFSRSVSGGGTTTTGFGGPGYKPVVIK